VAIIRTSGGFGTDVSSWYEMWEAIQAVNGMCVRLGLVGTAVHRGKRLIG